jgi:hypothetical protein
MIPTFHGYAAALSIGPGQLQSGFDDFRAGVAKPDVVKTGGSDVSETLRRHGELWIDQDARRYRVTPQLLLDCCHHGGVPVAEQEDTVPGAVKITMARFIDDAVGL